MANTKVTGDVIANGTISTVHLADDAITAAKLDSTATGITFADLTVDTNTLYVDAANNRVGIGTTSPGVKFEVSGTNDAKIRLTSTNSSDVLLQFGDSNDGNIGRIGYENSNDSMYFYTNNLERMRIDSSGNVLINRTGTSGLGKLNVDGGADFTGGNVLLCRDTGYVGIGTTNPQDELHLASLLPSIRLEDTDDNYYHRIRGNGSNLIIVADAGNAANNSSIRFQVDADEKMRITDNGNVGIGTTTFASTSNLQLKLGNMGSGIVGEIFDAVDNADNSRIIICGGGTGTPQFSMRHYSAGYGIDMWLNTSSPWDTYIDNRNATSGFIFRNNCNNDGGEDELMRITGSGNVGIGTTSPGAKLEVSGSLFFRDFVRGYVGSSTTQYVGATWLNASDGLFYVNSGGVHKVLLDSNGDSYLNGGNVGIGTTSPTTIASGYTSVTTNGTNGGGLVMQVNGTATGYLYAESGALVLNNTSGVMQFYNAGSERMRIDSSGRVGINVTPSYSNVPLHTKKLGGSDAYNIFEGDSAWVFGEVDYSGTKVCQVAGRYGHHNGINVDTAGQVGIGTVIPTVKLEIYGSFRARGDQNALIELTNTSGNTKAYLGNAGNEGDLGLYTSGNVKTVYLSSYYNSYFNGNGNVGIGTTSPQSKLHVNGGGINLEQGGQLTERTTGVESSAVQNTWYTVHTFNQYELTLFFLLAGFEDDLGDGNNRTAVFVDSGNLSYGSGFAPTRLSGSTSIEAQRSGQALQIRFTHTAGGSNRQLRWSLITVTGN